VLPAVLAECVFVLESFYEHPRGHISSALGRLISSPGVEIAGRRFTSTALERYRKQKVHFVDCLLAATAAAEDIPVATFDQDFRKFADVRVETRNFPSGNWLSILVASAVRQSVCNCSPKSRHTV